MSEDDGPILLEKMMRRWALVASCAPLVMLAGCPKNQAAAPGKMPAQATAPAIAAAGIGTLGTSAGKRWILRHRLLMRGEGRQGAATDQ